MARGGPKSQCSPLTQFVETQRAALAPLLVRHVHVNTAGRWGPPSAALLQKLANVQQQSPDDAKAQLSASRRRGEIVGNGAPTPYAMVLTGRGLLQRMGHNLGASGAYTEPQVESIAHSGDPDGGPLLPANDLRWALLDGIAAANIQRQWPGHRGGGPYEGATNQRSTYIPEGTPIDEPTSLASRVLAQFARRGTPGDVIARNSLGNGQARSLGQPLTQVY